MIYLDANIFICAALNTNSQGRKADALLKKIQQGAERAETSVLTFDEVFWAVRKYDLEIAYEVCEALLNFPNLEIVPATREIALSAMSLIREYHIDPRDALHAATAIAEKADFIVSTDIHFTKINGLKRKDL